MTYLQEHLPTQQSNDEDSLILSATKVGHRALRREAGITEAEHRASLREAGITQAEYRASFYWDDEPLSDDVPQHDVSW